MKTWMAGWCVVYAGRVWTEIRAAGEVGVASTSTNEIGEFFSPRPGTLRRVLKPDGDVAHIAVTTSMHAEGGGSSFPATCGLEGR